MQRMASHRKGRQAGTMGLLALGLLVAGCSDHERAVPQVSSSCLGVSYPADTELTILGTLEGDRVDVRGGWFTRPQVIVISSYQKIVWDFSRFPADKLRGVIASGLERPEIVGVATGIPVRTVMDYESPPNCGNEFLVYHGGPALDHLVTTMEKMTKLTATRFRGSYHATAFDVKKMPCPVWCFGSVVIFPLEISWIAASVSAPRRSTVRAPSGGRESLP